MRAAGAKILLASDGSEYSRAAARSVAERPWPEGTEVQVITVTDPVVRSVGYEAPETIGNEEGGAKEIIDEAVEMIRGSGLPSAGEVIAGASAKTAIVERAQEWGADLVVVGSHGRGGVKRLLLGAFRSSLPTTRTARRK